MTRVWLNHLSWPEVEAAAAVDPLVLIPLGTQETQGRHAPMGYDALLAAAVAEAVARESGSLVVPTLPFGYSRFSRPYPGTISLRAETVRAILVDIVDSLLNAGFRRLFFLNNHGLNEPILGHVADRFQESHGLDLLSVQPSKLAQELARDLYDDPAAAFAHGGEPTVSLMLHLFPDDVSVDGATQQRWGAYRGLPLAGPSAVRFRESTVRVYTAFEALAPSGGAGDPTQASAEKGRIMFRRVVDYLVAFVENVQLDRD